MVSQKLDLHQLPGYRSPRSLASAFCFILQVPARRGRGLVHPFSIPRTRIESRIDAPLKCGVAFVSVGQEEEAAWLPLKVWELAV